MNPKIKHSFHAKIWKSGGKGGWHFVSLPQNLSLEIRNHLKWQEEGWGRLKATAQIGKSIWDTAIWYDNKAKTYLLPIKASVRKDKKISEHDSVEVGIFI